MEIPFSFSCICISLMFPSMKKNEKKNTQLQLCSFMYFTINMNNQNLALNSIW